MVVAVLVIILIVSRFSKSSFNTSNALSEKGPASMYLVGQDNTIYLMLDTGGKDVAGVDAKLKYDPKEIRITSLNRIQGSLFSSYPALNVSKDKGEIYISANIGAGKTASPINGNSIQVASFDIIPTNNDVDSEISFMFVPGSRNDSNVVPLVASGQDVNDLLGNVSSYHTLSALQTATPTPTPKTRQSLSDIISSFFTGLFGGQ